MEKSIFKEEEKKKVEVVLLGQRLALKSNRSESYLQKLANFVAEQIEDVRKSSRSISTHQSVLLIALKLADLLKQREDELFELKDIIRKKASVALSDVENVLTDLRLKNEFDLPPKSEGQDSSTKSIEIK
ncbi:MAG TPA: cell division protein ZapA [Myxococcota bacterium]|nr:cell division protein ZapA [Myxococcota bacterium]